MKTGSHKNSSQEIYDFGHHTFKRLPQKSLNNLKQDREFVTSSSGILEQVVIGSASLTGRCKTIPQKDGILTDLLYFVAAKPLYIFAA